MKNVHIQDYVRIQLAFKKCKMVKYTKMRQNAFMIISVDQRGKMHDDPPENIVMHQSPTYVILWPFATIYSFMVYQYSKDYAQFNHKVTYQVRVLVVNVLP